VVIQNQFFLAHHTKSVNKFVCACVSRGSPLQGAAHRGSAGRAAQELALAAQAGIGLAAQEQEQVAQAGLSHSP